MKSAPHKIIMTNPCHENWEEMTDNSKGKFCASCQTDVIDFTQMSNTEIIDYFKNNKITKGCGRFYKKQLDTIQIPVDEHIFSYDLKHWQKFLVVVLFCFGQELFQVQLVFAQETTSDSTVVSEVVDSSFVDSNLIDLKLQMDSIESKTITINSEYKTIEVNPEEYILTGVIAMGDFQTGDLPVCSPTTLFPSSFLLSENQNNNSTYTSIVPRHKSNNKKEDNDKSQNQSMILPSLITFRKTRRKKK